MSQKKKVLLELKKLKKYFPVRRGVQIKALEDVSFSIYEGEKFGVVGESGCGKSTLGRVILQLYPQTSGACIYYGRTRDEMCPRYLCQGDGQAPGVSEKGHGVLSEVPGSGAEGGASPADDRGPLCARHQ